jgi:hypothetical protein
VPTLHGVSVTNISLNNQSWETGKFAEAPDTQQLPQHYEVKVGADEENQPPAGFLNNPAHQFVVRGTFAGNRRVFVSGLLQYDAGQSEPPDLFIFSV